MIVFRTPHFKREARSFPKYIRQALEKQVTFLVRDIRHPSLRAKKYDEERKIRQARVTEKVRFYFRIEADAYILLNIRRHTD